MKNPARNINAKFLALLLALMLAMLMPHGSAYAQDRPAFSQQQLEQTLAPIALYPDPLLSQILMASTYPLEVVEAARWSRSHPHSSGEDAVRAAENESWDPSVKSLLAFPHVLARMDEDLQWLQTLGDAFLGQEPQVMDAVQNLRRRAQIAGNLRSDERQRILETGSLLVVQPADPQIIYVPYYDPRVVYGPWWWPNYSPVYWRPFPGYSVWPGLAGGFYWGPSIRISAGYFFGGFDWPRRHVRVVQSNYYYRAPANHRVSTIHLDRPPGSWQHDPLHRRGVAYRGAEVQQRFADAGARPDGGRHPDRDDARRQNQQRAQPNPAVSRPGESRNDVRRTGVQPAGDAPAPAAIQRVTVTQASGTNGRADRRDQVKDLERGGRSAAGESRQATRPANAVPPVQRNRGNVTPSASDQTERSARPRAGESKQEPRPSSATRQEAQRGGERPKEVQSNPEARRDPDTQHRRKDQGPERQNRQMGQGLQ